MNVVTFYSYKGGVGRSNALANVAYSLAVAGERVLVVDFDLEAPSLNSQNFFPPIKDPSRTGGVIDYILEFVEGKGEKIPDLNEHVYVPRLARSKRPRRTTSRDLMEGSTEGVLNLKVMPAGSWTKDYAEKLYDLDWKKLYSQQQGFLLLETLKKQWDLLEWSTNTKGPGVDYVLIDSRTGDVDVAGICTRQLADTVVHIFFPNDQNVRGQKKQVELISKEPDRTGRILIEQIFVPSRLPTLDDEESQLESNIRAAKMEFQNLGYELASRHKEWLRVDNYETLDWLSTVLFNKTRPKSRVAKQYAEIVKAIRIANPADSRGELEVWKDLSATSDRMEREQYQTRRNYLAHRKKEKKPLVNKRVLFAKGLAGLKAYLREHGDLQVPETYLMEDSFKLGVWVKNQRRDYIHGKLDPNQLRRLANLGFPGYKTQSSALTDRVLALQKDVLRTHTETQTIVSGLKKETTSLTQALQSPKVVGDWGEMSLKNLVEMAGMSKYCDFLTQKTFSDSEGMRLRPDMIVNLPGGRTLAVDAKVPMKHYQAYFEAETEDERNQCSVKYCDNVYKHVKELGSRTYWSQLEDIPEMVILYLPEPAYHMAMQLDDQLISRAYRNKVIVASPSMLLMTLKMAARELELVDAKQQEKRISETEKSAEVCFYKARASQRFHERDAALELYRKGLVLNQDFPLKADFLLDYIKLEDDDNWYQKLEAYRQLVNANYNKKEFIDNFHTHPLCVGIHNGLGTVPFKEREKVS